MNILILGPQGSGKGTQARLLTDRFGFFYFESGAYLRKIAERNEDLKASLARGEMVPDTEMTSYLAAFFDQEHLYDDVIFDGFPRTREQYIFFKNWLLDKSVTLDVAIVLNINEEETVKRLSARRSDPETGKIYNLITDPPPVEIETRLVQRDDDKPEGIKKRLELYYSRTVPLIEELKKDMEVIEVDGSRSIEEIQKDLAEIVERIKNGQN